MSCPRKWRTEVGVFENKQKKKKQSCEGIDKTAVNQRQTSDFNVQTNSQLPNPISAITMDISVIYFLILKYVDQLKI